MNDEAKSAAEKEEQHTSLSHGWDLYRKLVVPHNAGEVQVKETKMAFYAGATLVVSAIQNQNVEALKSMWDEAMEYRNQVIAQSVADFWCMKGQ